MLKIGKLLLVWFPNPFAAGSQMGTLSSHCEKNGSLNRDLLNFLYRYGIFWMPPGESSHPGGSEYVWQRGVEGVLG